VEYRPYLGKDSCDLGGGKRGKIRDIQLHKVIHGLEILSYDVQGHRAGYVGMFNLCESL
jgi:hypothetical protein